MPKILNYVLNNVENMDVLEPLYYLPRELIMAHALATFVTPFSEVRIWVDYWLCFIFVPVRDNGINKVISP